MDNLLRLGKTVDRGVLGLYFEALLDAVLGEREIFHIIECPVCGFEEIYYQNAKTKRLIGRACSSCNFVQKFEIEHKLKA